MHIVLLESLGVPQEVLAACARPLVEAGHTFHAYAREEIRRRRSPVPETPTSL